MLPFRTPLGVMSRRPPLATRRVENTAVHELWKASVRVDCEVSVRSRRQSGGRPTLGRPIEEVTMRTFTVAAVQIAPLPGPLTAESVAANCAKGAEWLRRCVAATGAELAVLPETA